MREREGGNDGREHGIRRREKIGGRMRESEGKREKMGRRNIRERGKEGWRMREGGWENMKEKEEREEMMGEGDRVRERERGWDKERERERESYMRMLGRGWRKK